MKLLNLRRTANESPVKLLEQVDGPQRVMTRSKKNKGVLSGLVHRGITFTIIFSVGSFIIEKAHGETRKCSSVILGAEFLHRVYPDLANSKPVSRSLNKNSLPGKATSALSPVDRIRIWTEFSALKVNKYQSNRSALNHFKDFVLFNIVFDPSLRPAYKFWSHVVAKRNLGGLSLEEIKRHPDRFSIEMLSIIRARWSPIEGWIDFLVSPEASAYPFWLKYWSLVEVLKLTDRIDPETQLYVPRDSRSLESYPEVDSLAFHKMAKALVEKLPLILKKTTGSQPSSEVDQASGLDGMSFNRWYRGQTEDLFVDDQSAQEEALLETGAKTEMVAAQPTVAVPSTVALQPKAALPSKVGGVYDIALLGQWVNKKRTERDYSLEIVARKLDILGYPVSTNKLWRLENTDKRPLKKLDTQLLFKLEELFGEKFIGQTAEAGQPSSLVESDVLSVIKSWPQKPTDFKLMATYDVISLILKDYEQVFKVKTPTEGKTTSVQPSAEGMDEIARLGLWVKEKREERDYSLEILARKLDLIGFSTSTNKLWRIENTDKRPLKKLDAMLLFKLEELFGEKFRGQYTDVGILRGLIESDVLSMLKNWPQKPSDSKLMAIYDALTVKIKIGEARKK